MDAGGETSPGTFCGGTTFTVTLPRAPAASRRSPSAPCAIRSEPGSVASATVTAYRADGSVASVTGADGVCKTHTYDEATAEEIRARLPAYLEVLTELLAVLRAKMADRGSAP